ncbi:unnamed protein product [Miscanthus lutarioriparius]|uniref:Uncharacterized protein n=1 Tax=Miscanthus lutarioriparius TaxID=422564 RepID=A0A811MWD7_9POAL|nr:unnamed protein product [Miscanthus lutarioriparius]
MENMLAQLFEGLETPRSSTEIVSKVLSQTSAASTFLKNAGLQTPGSKSAGSVAREAQLQEQLQAEKTRADLLQQELDTLKKKGEETEDALAKTQEVVLRTQQEMEEFKKKQEANDLLLEIDLEHQRSNVSYLACSALAKYLSVVAVVTQCLEQVGYVTCERICV